MVMNTHQRDENLTENFADVKMEMEKFPGDKK